MSKIVLKFKSPKELNELKTSKSVEDKTWCYAGLADSSLELDTDSLTIFCHQNQKMGKLNEWIVDENAFAMRLDDGTVSEGTILTYEFAVAMLGQLVGHELLADTLKQLGVIYAGTPSAPDVPDGDEGKRENEDSDARKV